MATIAQSIRRSRHLHQLWWAIKALPYFLAWKQQIEPLGLQQRTDSPWISPVLRMDQVTLAVGSSLVERNKLQLSTVQSQLLERVGRVHLHRLDNFLELVIYVNDKPPTLINRQAVSDGMAAQFGAFLAADAVQAQLFLGLTTRWVSK